MDQNSFSSLKLRPELLNNIVTLGYTEMTPIQTQSLPHVIEGKDVIAQAKTGSGKTAAFGLGLLNSVNTSSLRVQSLVLCPTRELADQVAQAIRQLARTLPNVKVLTLCGGMPFRPQTTSLQHGAHIVVGTPGRIAKHLRKKSFELDQLKTLVLDEGDRMLEMGFQEQLDSIIDETPKERQTLLFSATFPDTIQSVADDVMIDPIMIKIESKHDSSSIKQHFYKVEDNDQRIKALRLLLMQHRPESTVIFCNTKKDTITVTDELIDHGFSALDLHGDLEQRERDETLVRFANKSISILVATDVAARGLDIDSLDAVFNYHVSRDCEVHVHRIGRTGRAGSTGIACSIFSEKEHYKMERLQEFLGEEIKGEVLPDESVLKGKKIVAPMSAIKIKIGKKQKIRAGNILGALTGENGLAGTNVGKINIGDNWSYVAVARDCVDFAVEKLAEEQWKGRPIEGWVIES